MGKTNKAQPLTKLTSDRERDNKHVNNNMQAVTSLSKKRKHSDVTEEVGSMFGEGSSEGVTVAEMGMTRTTVLREK